MLPQPSDESFNSESTSTREQKVTGPLTAGGPPGADALAAVLAASRNHSGGSSGRKRTDTVGSDSSSAAGILNDRNNAGGAAKESSPTRRKKSVSFQPGDGPLTPGLLKQHAIEARPEQGNVVMAATTPAGTQPLTPTPAPSLPPSPPGSPTRRLSQAKDSLGISNDLLESEITQAGPSSRGPASASGSAPPAPPAPPGADALQAALAASRKSTAADDKPERGALARGASSGSCLRKSKYRESVGAGSPWALARGLSSGSFLRKGKCRGSVGADTSWGGGAGGGAGEASRAPSAPLARGASSGGILRKSKYRGSVGAASAWVDEDRTTQGDMLSGLSWAADHVASDDTCFEHFSKPAAQLEAERRAAFGGVVSPRGVGLANMTEEEMAAALAHSTGRGEILGKAGKETGRSWGNRWKRQRVNKDQVVMAKRWHGDVDTWYKRLWLSCTGSHTLLAWLVYRGSNKMSRAQTVQILVNSMVFEVVVLCMQCAPPGDPTRGGAPQ